MATGIAASGGSYRDGGSNRFSAWLNRMPPGMPAEYQRFYTLARIGYPLALLVHVAFLVFFWHLGVGVLVAANIASIAVYAAACWWTARGRLKLAFAIALVEITAHAILATVCLGFDSAFGAFLLVALAVTLLAPFLPRPARFALATGFAVLAVALGAYGFRSEPLVRVSADWLTFFFASNGLMLCLCLAMLIAAYEWAADAAEAALQREYERAETLLANVLPEEIALRLKDSPDAIAEEFTEVTVLFADIVGFTRMAEDLAPARIIAMLNDVFSDFDDLVDRHGLEKIKTIGDAYMVVAGLPQPRPDHAAAMASLALDMQQAVSRRRRPDGAPLAIRIGMNSGPVVAGVIGHRKFAYDLWGDAVNVAARMESQGEPGRIQITEQCRRLLEADFVCSEGQQLDVKGKGAMRTHFLESRRADVA